MAALGGSAFLAAVRALRVDFTLVVGDGGEGSGQRSARFAAKRSLQRGVVGVSGGGLFLLLAMMMMVWG
jgi:hypothetical protein